MWIAGAGAGSCLGAGPRVAALAAFLLAAGAGSEAAAPHAAASGEVARARFLMGTRLAIETDVPVPARAFEAAFDEVARLETILSNWTTTSEITRLNRKAARAPVRCSPELFGAISTALRWAEATGGAFDPTVEPLVVALGLRGDRPPPASGAPGEAPGGPAPPDVSIGGVLPAGGAPAVRLPVGWRHVRLGRRSRSVSFDAPGVGIDLGGIGKGIALDAAASVLRRHGVRRALLDFGGQVLAIGRPQGAPVWVIGIADPSDRDRAIGAVGIADVSVATSGNAERSVMTPHGPVGHILDPKEQRPASFAGSVTVAGRDATSADALSTALFVMGPERGTAWADRREIPALYLWRDGHGLMQQRATRAFMDRFEGWDDATGS